MAMAAAGLAGLAVNAPALFDAAFAQQRPMQGGPGGTGGPAARSRLPIIDVHTHLQPPTGKGRDIRMDWDGAARSAIGAMDEFGVRLSVIMSPPMSPERAGRYEIADLLAVAKRHPDRFAVMAGGSTLNPMIQSVAKSGEVSAKLRRQFEQVAEDLLRQGAIGFGEMTALHFSLFEQHPFEEVSPDHPLFLLLSDIAARHDVPIDFHIEIVTQRFEVPVALHSNSARNPSHVAENLRAFERLLAHNRGAKIVWDHLGMDTTNQRTPELTRRLLREHPNLYIGISPKGGPLVRNWLMQKGRGINPDWRAVIVEFPDRFVIGTDSFYQPDAPTRRMPVAAPLVPRLVHQLPPRVARMVAYENAQRVFGISPVAR